MTLKCCSNNERIKKTFKDLIKDGKKEKKEEEKKSKKSILNSLHAKVT